MDVAAVVGMLREEGRALLPPLTTAQIEDVNTFLLSKPVFPNAHVPQTARNLDPAVVPVPRTEAQDSECVCVSLDDAIMAPHLLERALELTDVAASYLNHEPPVLYSANAFWTRPGAEIRGDIHEFHRDQDDERFFCLFAYLTPVQTIEDGPNEIEGPDRVVRATYGAAGTMFLADTSYPHRGRKPLTQERGIAWFRWGISPRPPANVWDGNEPIPRAWLGKRYPKTLRQQLVLRLLAV